MAPCADCGVDEESIGVPDAISAIKTFPRRYREALARIPADALTRRPDPDTWSALEYTVHVREVLQLLAAGLPIVLDEPDTKFPSFDADDSASRWPEWALDPELALSGIATASGVLVSRAEATPWEAWDRPFTVGTFTHPAAWIVQHAAHEGSHHLRDIERVGRLVGATPDDE
jgi:DinB superfamily